MTTAAEAIEAIRRALPEPKHYRPGFGWNGVVARERYYAAVPPEALRAILDHMAELERANAWQPIETAPKDHGCTMFDVWAGGERIADCFWGKPTYGAPISTIVYEDEYDCNGPVYAAVRGASAWRPLPTAPDAADRSAG